MNLIDNKILKLKLRDESAELVKEYIEILNKDGEAFANMFLNSKSRYLKKGFDPKKYIK